jgi:hypothetical protein
MFKINEKEFESLDLAMKHAKTLGTFVTIVGKDFEVCGKFGVDAVENAVLPDGNTYSWTMRRDGTHRSWRKKLS